MVVKDIKKQKPALHGSKRLLRNVVFCLNKTTLSGTTTSLEFIAQLYFVRAEYISKNHCFNCLFVRGIREIGFVVMGEIGI